MPSVSVDYFADVGGRAAAFFDSAVQNMRSRTQMDTAEWCRIRGHSYQADFTAQSILFVKIDNTIARGVFGFAPLDF